MTMYKEMAEAYKRIFIRLILILVTVLIAMLIVTFLKPEKRASSYQHLNNNTIQINDTLFVTMPDGDTAKFIIKRYE